MSSSAVGPEAVACLGRILETQLRLVELQEAQVRLLERCAPAPPPPPGEQGARAAAEPASPPSITPRGIPSTPPVKPPIEPFSKPAGLAAAETGERKEESVGDVQQAASTADAGGREEEKSSTRQATSGPGPRTDPRSKLSEEMMICGAWEPEISHHNLVRKASRSPDRIPIALQWFLLVLGVLSPVEVSAGWRRSVYQIHRACVLFSLIISAIIEAVRMYFAVVVIGVDMEVTQVMAHVLLMQGRLFIILPSFFVWRHQFSPRGAILALMSSMDKHQIPWQQLTNGVRIACCVSVGGVALIFYTILWPSVVRPILHSTGREPARSVSLCLGILQFILDSLHLFVFLGSHYLVFFACRLHRHDLLCYAGAMVKAMEGDSEASDVVPILKKLELQITARLRNASRTWVRFTVYEILILGSWALISILFLIAGRGVHQWLGTFVIGSTLVVVLLAPMAAVAETFEYDVLRALNNPSILKGAQKYFGQQLLSHLSSLDWGFRVGGAVIGQGMLTKIAMTLLIGVLTTVSNTIQSEFGAAVF